MPHYQHNPSSLDVVRELNASDPAGDLEVAHRHDFAEYQGGGIYACSCGSTDNGTGGAR